MKIIVLRNDKWLSLAKNFAKRGKVKGGGGIGKFVLCGDIWGWVKNSAILVQSVGHRAVTVYFQLRF